MSQDLSKNMITPEMRSIAERHFYSMPLIRHLGFSLDDIKTDLCVVSVESRDDLNQPGGILHGGVTATLIDTAMAFAVRTRVEPEVLTATIDLTVHYLRPIVSGRAVCVAKVARAGKRIFTVTAEVFDKDEKLVATAVSAYTKV